MQKRLSGGTEGLGTKVIHVYKGVLKDSRLGDFEADGSGFKFVNVTNETRKQLSGLCLNYNKNAKKRYNELFCHKRLTIRPGED